MKKSTTIPQTTVELARALLEQAHKLLASATAAKPAEPSAPPTRAASPRVAKLLHAMDVTIADLHACRNVSTPRGAQAVAARRAVVELLAADDASPADIARETGLSKSTVREYLRQ